MNGENWFFGTLFYLLVTASIVLYYAACLTNPGFIPVTKVRKKVYIDLHVDYYSILFVFLPCLFHRLFSLFFIAFELNVNKNEECIINNIK